ncbi:LPS export ABC transporter periplasmic protein LptC [candidate division KSB1 bacterium]|nr:LPS export ABC transporter periplasmic protein LptC [candidate division KSB1 bacterium]NIR68817.1 LPS export ABC transporter periplasmic protein LptC [candidate division KSB1 bacterium]NIS27180.1 LPS export ABC transporter periplasmic protein LptC [candidate division KSB1 bacterium]NIT74065.1 LPS export ABC transporter periplasmic protein LptC [candidate division KSB1 bacterium]NIU26930.1 LPS export ABC transporter periplasmic protein LptC [candidate division KSB1 bacterium]
MRFIRLNLLVLFFLFLCSCHSEQELTSTPPELGDVPDQESWNSTLTMTNNGMVSSRIEFERMQRFSRKKIAEFSGVVEIDFFDKSGKHISYVRSDKALLHEITRRIELTGSVLVRAEDGLRLQTEKLVWDESRNKLLSDEYIKVVTAERDTIHGIGFESDKNLRNWTIKKPWGVTQQNLKIVNSTSTDDTTSGNE